MLQVRLRYTAKERREQSVIVEKVVPSIIGSRVQRVEQNVDEVIDDGQLEIMNCIDEYIGGVFKGLHSYTSCKNPITFWKNSVCYFNHSIFNVLISQHWKELAHIAFEFLSIPATSASNERTFSNLGICLATRRNKTETRLLRSKTVVYANKDLLLDN